MAKHRRTSSRESARPDPATLPAGSGTGHGRAAAEQVGEAYWSVDGAGWSTIRPGLPGHVVDLLAPPIVVGVARVPATTRPVPAVVAHPTTVSGVRAVAPVPDRAAPGVKRGPFLDTRR